MAFMDSLVRGLALVIFCTVKLMVHAFAALKWFKPEGGAPETYDGGRELEDLAIL